MSSPSKYMDHLAFRFMILTVLFFGGLGPVFRNDVVSKYVSAVCVLVLAVLAGITLFRRREDGGVKKYKWFGKPMTRVRRGGLVQTYDLRHERMFRTFEEGNDFIFRSTVLILLTGFGLISNFRTEIEFQCLAAMSVIALTTLAGFTLFRRRSP